MKLSESENKPEPAGCKSEIKILAISKSPLIFSWVQLEILGGNPNLKPYIAWY
jgi:hypothetical protein